MFVLLRTERMQLRNHADAQTVKRSKRYKGYATCVYIHIYRDCIKFRMLEMREIEIALLKLSGGTAQLCTWEGALPTTSWYVLQRYSRDLIFETNTWLNFETESNTYQKNET